MTTLLIGFDSAWSPANAGAIVGLLRADDGTLHDLGPPQPADFHEAETRILDWQARHQPDATLVLIDQPTIVNNATGQRPVEHLVSSPVSRRRGGMQPANLARADMFGVEAPIWWFLDRFGGPANPLGSLSRTWVIETYPVLILIARGWTRPNPRPTGRLPKYNPARRQTFTLSDWRFVVERLREACGDHRLAGIGGWLDRAAELDTPRKRDQDGLDACLCLLAALSLAESASPEANGNLMVGDMDTGCLVVPYDATLTAELEARCQDTQRRPSEWVRPFHLSTVAC